MKNENLWIFFNLQYASDAPQRTASTKSSMALRGTNHSLSVLFLDYYTSIPLSHIIPHKLNIFSKIVYVIQFDSGASVDYRRHQEVVTIRRQRFRAHQRRWCRCWCCCPAHKVATLGEWDGPPRGRIRYISESHRDWTTKKQQQQRNSFPSISISKWNEWNDGFDDSHIHTPHKHNILAPRSLIIGQLLWAPLFSSKNTILNHIKLLLYLDDSWTHDDKQGQVWTFGSH